MENTENTIKARFKLQRSSRALLLRYFPFALLLLLAAWLRFLDTRGVTFWYDEAFTAITVRSGWREMFQIIIADKVHPPTYYILLKLWTYIFTTSELSLRAFSMVAGVGVVLVAAMIGKIFWQSEGFSKNEKTVESTGLALLPAIIFAISPFFVTYSVEVRSYMLISLLTVWLFYEIIKQMLLSENTDSSARADANAKLLSVKFWWRSLKRLVNKRIFLLSIALLSLHYIEFVFVVALLVISLIFHEIVWRGLLLRKFKQIGHTISMALLPILPWVVLGVLDLLHFRQWVSTHILSGDEFGRWGWVGTREFLDLFKVFFAYLFGVVRFSSHAVPTREFTFLEGYHWEYGVLVFLIYFGMYLVAMGDRELSAARRKVLAYLFFVTNWLFAGFALLSWVGVHLYMERFMISIGALFVLSFGMLLSVMPRKILLMIGVLYVSLLLFLAPVVQVDNFTRVNERIQSATEENRRCVFYEPMDMIIARSYFPHANLWFIGDPADDYAKWAVLERNHRLNVEDLTPEDCVVE